MMRDPEIDIYLEMLEEEMEGGRSLSDALSFHGNNMTTEEAAELLDLARCASCFLHAGEYELVEGLCSACRGEG